MQVKRYISYIVFFIILILGDILIGKALSVLSKKQKYDKRIELLLQHKINKDIIVIGSSEALNDYSPEIITKSTGLTCYNLGVSGSNPIFHETMLDLLLMNSIKPKLIIYNIDDYAALYSKKGIIYRLDVLYPYVDDAFINEKVGNELKKNRWATTFSSTYRQNVNFVNSIKYLLKGQEKVDYRMNNVNEYGATLIDPKPGDKKVVFSKRNISLKDLIHSEDYEKALVRIQDKCLKNGIQLVFCYPPQFVTPTKGFHEKMEQVINKKVNVLNFSDLLKDQNYFFDPEHLNKTGANYFSQLLSDELKKIKK